MSLRAPSSFDQQASEIVVHRPVHVGVATDTERGLMVPVVGKLSVELGEDELFRKEPKARGYLRPRQGYRLYEIREELVRRLTADVKTNRDWLLQSLEYVLARQESLKG